MPTPTPRIGYLAPLTSDDFDTSEIADQWFLADDYPGIFICTSTTRPTGWDSTQEGMLICETDSDLIWRWNGSGFVRAFPVGHLDNDRRTSNLTVTSGIYNTVCQAAVAIPTGGRNIQVNVGWSNITGGAAVMGLYRDATLLMEWQTPLGTGGSQTFTDIAPASGSVNYTFKVKNSGGTTTLVCSASSPASIDAVEV